MAVSGLIWPQPEKAIAASGRGPQKESLVLDEREVLLMGDGFDVVETADRAIVVAVQGYLLANQPGWMGDHPPSRERPVHHGAPGLLHRYVEQGISGVEAIAGRFRYVIVDRRLERVWIGTDRQSQYPWYWDHTTAGLRISDSPDGPSDSRLDVVAPFEWMSFIELGVRSRPRQATRGLQEVPAARAVGFDSGFRLFLSERPEPPRQPVLDNPRTNRVVDRAERACFDHLQGLTQLGPLQGAYVDGGWRSFLATTLAVRAGIGQPPLYFPADAHDDIVSRIRQFAKYLGLSALGIRSRPLTPAVLTELVRGWRDPWVSGLSYQLNRLWVEESAGWYITGLQGTSGPGASGDGDSTTAPRTVWPSALWDLFETCIGGPDAADAVLAEVARRWVPRDLQGCSPHRSWPRIPQRDAEWIDRVGLACARARAWWGSDFGDRCTRWQHAAREGDDASATRLFRLCVAEEWLSQRAAPSPQVYTSAR